MSFSIRPVVYNDYESVCRLFAHGDEFHSRGLPNLFRPVTPSRSVEFFETFLKSDDANLWVAETPAGLVGLIEWNVVDRPEQPNMFARRFVLVNSLLVDKSARRQGIGTALMNAVHRWARDRQIAEIELNVHEFNQGAIAFYEQLGYTTASRRMRRLC